MVDRLQTHDPVPPKPAADDETRCRVALADAIPPREWESLRLRREHVTSALYRDTSIAVAATRLIGRYPTYISEVARECQLKLKKRLGRKGNGRRFRFWLAIVLGTLLAVVGGLTLIGAVLNS